MKSAITLSQVAEATGGPFVLTSPLPEAFAIASEMGFDAVELFLPGPDFVSIKEVKDLASTHGLSIAAVGTGAGFVRHGLTLMDPAPEKRAAALDFLNLMIDFGGALGAPAILGSVQGKYAPGTSRASALDTLADALGICADRAASHGVPFIYEPLNRYETNLLNDLAEAASYLEEHALQNITLLADLFHMNIEAANISDTILAAGKAVGHVHFADTNRRAVGFGHLDAKAVIASLRSIGYSGYLSAEILPLPDPMTAARQTITSLNALLAESSPA